MLHRHLHRCVLGRLSLEALGSPPHTDMGSHLYSGPPTDLADTVSLPRRPRGPVWRPELPTTSRNPEVCPAYAEDSHFPGPSYGAVVVCFLGTVLYSYSSCLSKIRNPKSTNLAGSLDGAPIHKTLHKFEDKNPVQRSKFHTALHSDNWHSMLLKYSQAAVRLRLRLRARCTAAVGNHNTTPPLRPRRGLIALGGRHMVEPEGQAQKKCFLGPRHVLATEA